MNLGIGILRKLARRKVLDASDQTTELKRVLSTLDLTLLGIGSTLGIGIYVLAGSVAKNDAGPAVIISFLLAAFASVLAGLCYAEFGSRVPKAGSAYVYSYVCVGELIAFVVGWNLIMEYVIGVASVAKGYSGYVDSLTNNTMKKLFLEVAPIPVGFLSDYVDFFAFGITLVVTCVLAFGVKESSLFNNIFTCLNLFVVGFVVIAGAIYCNPSNWNIIPNATLTEPTTNSSPAGTEDLPKIGVGGFAPFGIAGIMKGAATCFYGFVGFDVIATTGEEAKNPQRAIPLAIIFSLFFIFLAYFGISTVLTMMVPYYLQDAHAPLPEAFTQVNFPAGKWIVTFGALFGLSTSLLGSMFPMPRVIYAMATDGVLFKFLGKVHHRFQTPFTATILAGVFGGLMAAIFDLDALIDMMSIGTLTAYTLVAVCVLVLRYRKEDNDPNDTPSTLYVDAGYSDDWGARSFVGQIYNQRRTPYPTVLSSTFSGYLIFIYCITTLLFCGVSIFASKQILELNPLALFALATLGSLLILILISLHFQPVSNVKLTFKVPLVPFIPGLSVLANVYLIMNLTFPTWIRFGIWMLIGLLIYSICLLNGTTDAAYRLHLGEANKEINSSIVSSQIAAKEGPLATKFSPTGKGPINPNIS